MRAGECGISKEYWCSRMCVPPSPGLSRGEPDYRVRFARAGAEGCVPIHYELDDDHIVLITIDRPEAKNSADMEHFKQLRESWERFDADDDAWVAIITGVGDAFF